jgi:hypothetical protein
LSNLNHLVFEESVLPVITLLPGATLDDEVINQHSNAIVQQGPNVFSLKDIGVARYLSSVDDPQVMLTKLCTHEASYDAKQVHLLIDKMDEFPLPAHLLQYCMKYFRDIYDMHKTEAVVLLMLNKATKDWRVLHVLQISASGASVNYLHPTSNNDDYKYREAMRDKDAREAHEAVIAEYQDLLNQGYAVFGTIHSHCNFSAFHSGVDDADETNFTGLHITIGNVNSGWSYSARWMIDGAEFKRDITDVIGISQEELGQLSDVSRIEIEQSKMALMMPDLLRRHVVQAPKHQMWQPKETYGRATDLFDDNSCKNWKDWFTQEEEPEELDYKVVHNGDVILYDPVARETLLVSEEEYEDNKEYFSDCQLLQVLKFDVPEETDEGKEETETENAEEIKIVDFDARGEALNVFNLPALRGGNPKTEPIGKGTKLVK